MEKVKGNWTITPHKEPFYVIVNIYYVNYENEYRMVYMKDFQEFMDELSQKDGIVDVHVYIPTRLDFERIYD